MKRFKQFVLYSAIVLIPALFMTWKILATGSVKCEVCIQYKGASKCRNAEGPDQHACQQTATDNACAFLAAGMSDSIACGNTEPQSVKFE